MAFRSNLQSLRFSRGRGWKNLWIPSKFVDYKKYLIHDLYMWSYMLSKIWLENKNIKKSYSYTYDFFFEKSYQYSLVRIQKYNVDYVRLSQLIFESKLHILNKLKTANFQKKSFFLSLNVKNFQNLLSKKLLFYTLIACYQWPFLNNYFIKPKNTDFNLFQNLNWSYFIPNNLNNNLLFNKFINFWRKFNSWYIYNLTDNLTSNNIQLNSLKISSFLLNPSILKKTPNLSIFYQNWVHNSWKHSKKQILQSMPSSFLYINSNNNISNNKNLFFGKYVKLLIKMWLLDNFFFQKFSNWIGLNKDFINKQKNILLLWSTINNIMVNSIESIWSYFRTYLKIFSFENKIKITRSKKFFKNFFFFKKLIKNIIFGQPYSLTSLNNFINYNYSFNFTNNLMKSTLTHYFLNKFYFIKFWYKVLTKGFLFSLKILKLFLKTKKMNFFSKIFIIRKLWFFYLKKKKIPNIQNFFFLTNKKNYFTGTLTECIIFVLLNLWFVKRKKTITSILHLNKSKHIHMGLKFKSKKNFKDFLSLQTILKRSPWFTLLFFNNKFLKLYYNSVFIQWNTWFLKFKYFYFALSNLTPKLFFWIYQELLVSLNYNLLVHLINIYWQHFSLFYFFIIWILKKMYKLCDKKTQFFLSKPNKFFLQKKNNQISLFDYFSTSFKYFSNLMVNNIFHSNFKKKNFTVGDFSLILANLGTPNFFSKKKYYFTLNNYSYKNYLPLSSIFLPHLSIFFNSIFFFWKNSKFLPLNKKFINKNLPNYISKIPTYIQIEHFNMVNITATMLAILIKKKLEKDHLLSEIMWNISFLVSKSPSITGFMFLLKGRFSWKERASKICIKKGILQNTNIWSNLDYCELPIHLKYGTASVWIWLTLKNWNTEIISII